MSGLFCLKPAIRLFEEAKIASTQNCVPLNQRGDDGMIEGLCYTFIYERKGQEVLVTVIKVGKHVESAFSSFSLSRSTHVLVRRVRIGEQLELADVPNSKRPIA